MEQSLVRRLGGEFFGTGMLLTAIAGSGILATRLAGGNDGIALLTHGLACGEILFVIIVMFSPVSGAHFNPALTLVARLRGEIGTRDALAYVAVQITAAIAGVWLAHMMFGQPVIQLGTMPRTGAGQWLGEGVATFGLMLAVFRLRGRSVETIAAGIALYVMAAIWFTSSTCFANPAVTIARGLTATYTGIAPDDVPGFILAQIAGAVLALGGERAAFRKAFRRNALNTARQSCSPLRIRR